MGALFAILSTMLSAAKDIMSKRMSISLDAHSSTYASFAYALPGYLLILLITGAFQVERFEFSWYFLTLVFARSISDAAAEFLKMRALAVGDLSLVAPMISLAPVFMLIISPTLAGDSLSALGIFAVLLSVTGSLLLLPTRPASGTAHVSQTIVLSLGASVCFAVNTSLDRMAMKIASAPVSGFAMTALCALYFMPFVYLRPERRIALRKHTRPLIVRGMFEVGFMVLKLLALQHMQAPYVAAIQRSSVLLNIAAGKVVFGEKDFIRRVIAGIVIALGAILVLLA